MSAFTPGQLYLSHFWQQVWNSLLVGVLTAMLVLLIGTMASFAIGRLRIRFAGLLSSAAILTYMIPISFLAIPFYKVMHTYGLADNRWALIFVMVTFATPYAIFL